MKTSTLGSSRQALIRRMNGTSCPQHSHELLAETESAKNHNRRRRPAWPSARPRRGHCTAVAVTCAQCIPLRAARRAEPRRSGPTSVGVSRARTAALRTLRVAYSLTITAVFWRQRVGSSPSGSQSALTRKPLVRRRQGAESAVASGSAAVRGQPCVQPAAGSERVNTQPAPIASRRQRWPRSMIHFEARVVHSRNRDGPEGR